MASTSGYGYSLTANCSNLRRSGDTVYVDVSISGSSYYSGSLYIDGVSVGSSWSSANGGSSSGSRTLSWNNPGVFSSRDITCRLKYQIQQGGSTSNAYVYPSTGSLGARTYTVSYNKGANGSGTNTSATKTYGTALTLKGAIFTRNGYTQTGWSTSDGGSKVYNLSGSYTTNAGVTLYPYWEKNGFDIYRVLNETVEQVTDIYSVKNGVVKQVTEVYRVNNGVVTQV